MNSADKIVFWPSASSRYGTIAHRGHRETLGHGWTTGYQNIRAAMKKHRCSTTCHPSERSASWKVVGRCHPHVAAANAIQHTHGWVSHVNTTRAVLERSSGPTRVLAIRGGRPRTSGMAGAPTSK